MAKIHKITNKNHLQNLFNAIDLSDYKYVIIGSSFAALALTKFLKKKCLILEAGDQFISGSNKTLKISSLGSIKLKERNHSISFGGTSNLWTGTLSELSEFEIKGYQHQKLWPLTYDELKSLYSDSWYFFGYKINNFKIKNYKNFQVRKFEVQQQPLRVDRELLKTNADIFLNTKVEYIDEKFNQNIIYLKTNDNEVSSIDVPNIIICNGTFGSFELINKSIKRGFLSNLNKKFLGINYTNHPKFKFPQVINFKDNQIFNNFKKKFNYTNKKYYGLSINDQEKLKNNLNNSYFKFIPKYNFENDTDFFLSNFIYSNKKFIIKNLFNLFFRKKIFLSNFKKYSNLDTKKLIIFIQKPILSIINFQIIKYLLHISSIKTIKTNEYFIEFFFENTNSNSHMLFDQDQIKVKLDLSNQDKETFFYLIKKINKIFNINLKVDENFFDNISLTDASHHIGGISYINNDNSLIDDNLKLNNFKNIYICSSSVFPSGGSANPNLTIVAMAVRLARYLNKLK